MKEPITFERSRVLVNLVNEIQAKGINIPEKAIENIVELYVRVILSSSEDGFENSITPFCVPFDPFATIDFDNINDDTIQSINQLVIDICEMLEALHNDDPEKYPTVIDKDLVTTITTDKNIVIIFNEIQKMMHLIGAMAQDTLIHRYRSFAHKACSYWEFMSFNEKMYRFVVIAVQLMDGKQIFTIANNVK